MDKNNNENNDILQNVSSDSHENKQTDLSGEGIIFFDNLLTKEELSNAGYKKIPNDMTYKLEPLLQRVPEHIANSFMRKAAEKSFNEAVRGTFRCHLAPEMHLAFRKGQPDVFLGTGLDNISNKISGQASWIKNEAVFSVPTAPEIISIIYSALSVITCQHYLSEINKEIKTIESKLDVIDRKIDADHSSEIDSDYISLQEIFENLKFIKDNNSLVDNYHNQLLNIRKDSVKHISYYKTQISEQLKLFKPNEDNEEQISNNFEKVYLYQYFYNYAIRINIITYLIEIYLLNTSNKEKLIYISDKLTKIMNEGNYHINNTFNFEQNYINKSKFLNKFGKKEQFISGAIDFFDVIPALDDLFGDPVIPKDLRLKNVYDKKVKKELTQRKEKHEKSNKSYKGKITRLSSENQRIVDSVNNLIEQLSNKTELVYIDGEWYYKSEMKSKQHKLDLQTQSEMFLQAKKHNNSQKES